MSLLVPLKPVHPRSLRSLEIDLSILRQMLVSDLIANDNPVVPRIGLRLLKRTRTQLGE